MPAIEEIDDDTRERVRSAIATILHRKEKVAVNRVRDLAGANRSKVSELVRAFKAGQLPDPGAVKGGAGRWALTSKKKRRKKVPRPSSGRSSSVGQGGEGGGGEEERDLAELLEQAKTEEDLDAAASAAAAALARGELHHQAAGAIKALITERRQLLKAQREAPKEDPDEIFLASKDGALVLAAFEKICDQDRRSEVLEFVTEKLQEDLRELPSVDPLGAL